MKSARSNQSDDQLGRRSVGIAARRRLPSCMDMHIASNGLCLMVVRLIFC
jgi:hypothetical protein